MPVDIKSPGDAALETQLFWAKYQKQIAVFIGIAVLATIGYAGYRLYTEHRNSSAAAALSTAKTPDAFRQVISKFPNTAAAADARLLLAEKLRNERKFDEANAILNEFIGKHVDHQLISTADMALAANFAAMGKNDEALAAYQNVVARYPKSFNAPLALLEQVQLFKAKGQIDEARRVCERITTEYRESLAVGEAMQHLRSLKPTAPPQKVPLPGPVQVQPPPPPAVQSPAARTPPPK